MKNVKKRQRATTRKQTHKRKKRCTLQKIHLWWGGNQFSASSSIFDGKMAQSCHYFSRDDTFGLELLWLQSLLAVESAALHGPAERLQVNQQGNLLYGWTIILHKLGEISEKRNPAQGRRAGSLFEKIPTRSFSGEDRGRRKRTVQEKKERATRFRIQRGAILLSFLPLSHLLCLDRGSWGPGLCPGTLSTSQYSSAAHTP